jgi:endogenous inhibitor of DNA gyrase (YacG/DUF329 family)
MKPQWATEATNTGGGSRDSLPRLTCPTCGNAVVPVLGWNGPHLEASCPSCDKHIKWLKQAEPWVSLAGPRAAPPLPIIQLSMFEDGAA